MKCNDNYMAYFNVFMMIVVVVLEQKRAINMSCNPLWKSKMDDEMQDLYNNDTRDVVPSLPHNKDIGFFSNNGLYYV